MRGYVNTSVKHVNWCMSFAYDDAALIEESNDWWLSILAHLGFAANSRGIIKKTYDAVKDTVPTIKYDETMVWGISPFCLGTVHGYAFIYQLINQYKDTQYRILIAKESSKGILELCNEAFGGERLVYVNNNQVIEAQDLRFVVNTCHCYVPHSIMNVVVPLFLRPKPTLCLAALKTTDTVNVTGVGVLNQQQVSQLNIPSRFVKVKPEDFSEMDWMSMVYNCEELLVGWNSCYFKAIMYLTSGHKCKKVHCLIVGPCSLQQYREHGKTALEYAEKCNVQSIFHIYGSPLRIE
jgi:hypothetical protein